MLLTKTNNKVLKFERSYIPYRESSLTRLLQDSLGGNTNTCLIATVSPTDKCSFETISTLKFAGRAKLVVTKVKANNILNSSDTIVNKLQVELRQLKEVLHMRRHRDKHDMESQLISLKLENLRLKQAIKFNDELDLLKQENSAIKHQLKNFTKTPQSFYGASSPK